jgi:acetoin utilization deacetylase AcuC-like enzyme
MTTAYCFDPEHVHHREAGHPEQPTRLSAVMSRLRDTGWLTRMTEIPVSQVPLEAVYRVHSEEYVGLLEGVCARGGGTLDVDTYATEASFRIARRGLGGLLRTVDAVFTGEANNAFALIRPPGHHARQFAAMGFCLFGNVAVAARHAQAEHGVERVLIVDFDVHHGNGTQEMFYDDSSVLVCSSHQHPCYPGTGMIDETGTGAGKGFTVNIPYPPGTGDEALLDAYRRVLLPIAQRFEPELVLVSAGFDAHHLDPLANGALSARGFAELMRILLTIADDHAEGRLVATLEGGYHPAALAESVRACIAVMQEPATQVDDAIGPAPQHIDDLGSLIDELRRAHAIS